MCACFLRNSNKWHLTTNTLWKRRSISDSIGPPITRPHFQQPKASYSQFPQRKPKQNIDFSVPFAATVVSRFSSISNNGLIGWYLGLIRTRPVLTKSVTAAFIYTAADLSSQLAFVLGQFWNEVVLTAVSFLSRIPSSVISGPSLFERRFSTTPDYEELRTIAGSSSESYDLVRTLRMAGYGMIVSGPALHFWFNFMSRSFPKRDLISTFKKMFLGQAIMAPILTVIFFSANAGLQGESGTEIVARLKRDLVPTLINGVMFWPVCDFITFRFIPVHLQDRFCHSKGCGGTACCPLTCLFIPLVSNSFAYIWTVYMTYMASLEKAGTK